MIRKLSVSFAALAAMGIAGAASANDAEETINVVVDVGAFVEIQVNSTVTNTIDSAQDSSSPGLPFTVVANAAHDLWVEPDETIEIYTGRVHGLAEDGANQIGYFLNLDLETEGNWVAGTPMAMGVTNPRTVTGTGMDPNAVYEGSAGTTEYFVRATGMATDTADGEPAAPGSYTGTATIVANLN